MAEDYKASFSAGYVKILRQGNIPVEAFFAKIKIKDKLIMAIIKSGSSVDLISTTLYMRPGEPSQIIIIFILKGCFWRFVGQSVKNKVAKVFDLNLKESHT